MENHKKSIDVKLQLLNYATKDIERVLENKNERIFKEKTKLIEKSVEAVEELKYKVIEQMITDEAQADEIDEWEKSIQSKLEPFDKIAADIKGALLHLNERYVEKAVAASERKHEVKTSAKLPKLQISKFDGSHVDWFRFWNQYQAEIDDSSIPPVTKFSYLRDMLPAQALALVNGLPFTGEGYERAKNILQTKYGKPSEVVNAHIQRIMALPTINGNNTSRINEFYETLVNSVQSLETMKKLSEIQGYVRMTLDKLPGIRSDLVRLDADWQEWKFGQLIESLRLWTERNPTQPKMEDFKQPLPRKSGRSFTIKSEANVCVYCDHQHSPTNCEKITDINERRNILRSKHRCFNCTKSGHQASECHSRNCYNCNGRHHTSICDGRASTKTNGIMCSAVEESVIYPVVLVKVNGVKCRALLDSGAGSNYISEKLAQVISCKPKRTEQRKIEMLMSSTSTKVKIYEVDIQGLQSNFKIKAEVSTVQKNVLLNIPNPNYRAIQQSYQHLRGLYFNDNDPKSDYPIHLIIGVDVYCKIKMKKEPRIGAPGQPIAELTRFGWVLMSPGDEIDRQAYLTKSAHDYDELCRLDILGLHDTSDGDQSSVYSEFKEQLQRDKEGWYETGLLWKANLHELPNNKAASLRRTMNLINKLKRNPERLSEYDEKIKEQIEEGIVEPAPENVTGREYYIPHKPVRRETAETTKLRIVYDASAKPTDDSLSLNDCLETGPPLQKRLWNILTRNRMHPIALTGDLKQAFLQIRIRREDRDALRFHWLQDKSTLEIITLRFTRAVFGLVQSPFLLNGTLEYHLDTYEDEREIVQSIKDDIYVDDVIGGGNSTKEVQHMKEVIIKVFHDAGFKLHKWHSNVPELTIEENDETVTPKPPSEKSSILGVPWNERNDTFAVTFPNLEVRTTKRGILTYLASVFDPLGLTSPIMLKGKTLYRTICDRKIGWDQQLPEDLRRSWTKWLRRLPTQLEVPRPIPQFCMQISRVDLHAFADASNEGVSAVVYAVVTQASGISKGLICSKSRLAKKTLSIPRLELVAAHMATNLLTNTVKALPSFPIHSRIAWSDSTVALYWIKGNGAYKEFVKNRVAKINAQSDIEWRHITTDENPADVGSRGCQGDQLGGNWFSGPPWLDDEIEWPPDITSHPSTESETEAKKIKEIMVVTMASEDALGAILTKFSLSKALRITAWVQRFVKNCNAKQKSKRTKGALTTEEIECVKKIWIKQVQASHETTERFHHDKERLNLQRNSDGIYLCMGRIEGDYPTYLPTNDVFSTKLVEQSHMKTLHGGVGFTMSDVRKRFWIPRLRQITKGVIHRCHGCKRFHAIAFTRPRVGNLPTDRTVGNRPFQIIGLDFAGPFTYSTTKAERKAYVLLYACSLTRAVYLDVLQDQSFEGVIMSLKSLIARRTRPEKIYSDNFSSFVAASKWVKKVMTEEKLHDFLASQEIAWKFNLSRAPWWGGQFERLVGLMKQTLFKTLGKTKPTLEEYKSLMLDVEISHKQSSTWLCGR